MSFSYFAYGSNMLTKRMHINCPSAKQKCIAKLKVILMRMFFFKISLAYEKEIRSLFLFNFLECKNFF